MFTIKQQLAPSLSLQLNEYLPTSRYVGPYNSSTLYTAHHQKPPPDGDTISSATGTVPPRHVTVSRAPIGQCLTLGAGAAAIMVVLWMGSR